MKKVRIIFASLAITIASVSVFASSLVTTTFYRSSASYDEVPGTLPAADCFQSTTVTGCDSGSNQCTVPAPGDKIYLVSKIVDTSPCVLVKKP
jgi:hypothetical protein